MKRITVRELRARIMACPKMTNGPGIMDSPPLSEASDSDFQVDGFNHPGSAYPESPAGTITPPDSAPATPHNQSIIRPYAFNKSLVSHPSDISSSSSSYYPDAESNPVVLPSSLDFVPSGRSSFWQFPLFRREEVRSMNAQLVPHQGVQVF